MKLKGTLNSLHYSKMILKQRSRRNLNNKFKMIKNVEKKKKIKEKITLGNCWLLLTQVVTKIYLQSLKIKMERRNKNKKLCQ